MYVFAKLCYMVNNDKNNNYWYYLTEALKEN